MGDVRPARASGVIEGSRPVSGGGEDDGRGRPSGRPGTPQAPPTTEEAARWVEDELDGGAR
ncbi:hypothetical protein [Kitasatospora purpeofusca]|uniref:hypothetical protein n=1 Tax=Kitasatospora purpeofusca TaxID=67352 RepID=UPI000B2AAEE7|nr:hypothetical protein [Kitasatospora purpeofusca]